MNRVTGRGLAAAATVWALVDLAVHLATDQLEDPRVAGNVVTILAGVVAASLGNRRAARLVCWAGAALHASFAGTWMVVNGGAQPPAIILISVGIALLVAAGWRLRPTPSQTPTSKRGRWVPAVTGSATLAACALAAVQVLLSSSLAQTYDGRLVDADYFTPEPRLLSAGLGFEGTLGIPDLTEDEVRRAGGAWATDLDCDPDTDISPGQRTSAAVTSSLGRGFVLRDGVDVVEADGLPVVFSWPVVSDTVDPDQFRFTLSNGDVVTPDGAGLLPNWELNERQTVVTLGEFGNRDTGVDAIAPIRLEIVDPPDGDPLMLAGPDGEADATGLTLDIDGTGYDSGPTLVAAKLTRVDPAVPGEGGVFGASSAAMPNDEVALYGDQAEFRLRMLTTGGFSPDGIRGLQPSTYSDYFRLRARGADGSTVELTDTGVDYEVDGGTVRVLGLSDLGRKPGEDVPEDDCYQEDADNQIDIVLSGDESAMASITHLEMPGIPGGYAALYNPGGPGPSPFDEVTYTEPSPPLLLPVTIALDDPMQVTLD